jgi:hypothetical protein
MHVYSIRYTWLFDKTFLRITGLLLISGIDKILYGKKKIQAA